MNAGGGQQRGLGSGESRPSFGDVLDVPIGLRGSLGGGRVPYSRRALTAAAPEQLPAAAGSSDGKVKTRPASFPKKQHVQRLRINVDTQGA